METVIEISGITAGYNNSPRTEYRYTNANAHHSAVLGMFAAALGRRRGEDLGIEISINEIALDSGPTISDYQTIRGCVSNDGKPLSHAKITHRYYLTEPVLRVWVSGDVEALISALKRPVFQLYLGRRCCIPTGVNVRWVAEVEASLPIE